LNKIIGKKELTKDSVYEFEVEAPEIAAKALPGQFILLRAAEEGERIPLTIADPNKEKGTIDLIFQVVGKTTALLKRLEAGDEILDLVGPLGNPSHIEKVGTVVCVGGGTGIAVLYPTAKAFKEAGNRVISVVGARSKDLLILEEKMKSISDEVVVCTDDGSYGIRGLVTDGLKKVMEKHKDIQLAVSIGPVIMMKAVSEFTKPFNIKTVVSLNPIMVDGTGMCGGCRVTVGGVTKFCCCDGPEFDGHQVDFDELMKRQRAYLHHEKSAMDRCRWA
jgi:ferredoxin--NADP+ reductase